ncbi:MAG: L-threonylcarbamoyladenylate synthase [Candidatus Bathyarchaeia archaeon]
MRIFKATTSNVLTASRIVKEGGLVVYPTDTVYGLGCDPFNIKAVKQVFRVKGERRKPLPILASNIDHVKKIASLSRDAEKIAKGFWPGSLTLVIPKKITLPDVVTCNLPSVGVRIPKHDVALQLINLSNGLLVGTSANRTGEKPPRTAPEAFQQLGRNVDVILDGGSTTLGVPSTVVDLTTKKPRILRGGPISLEEILAVLSSNPMLT